MFSSCVEIISHGVGVYYFDRTRGEGSNCRVSGERWSMGLDLHSGWSCMWREVADIVVLRCGRRGRGWVGLVVVTVCVRSSAYQFS